MAVNTKKCFKQYLNHTKADWQSYTGTAILPVRNVEHLIMNVKS